MKYFLTILLLILLAAIWFIPERLPDLEIPPSSSDLFEEIKYELPEPKVDDTPSPIAPNGVESRSDELLGSHKAYPTPGGYLGDYPTGKLCWCVMAVRKLSEYQPRFVDGAIDIPAERQTPKEGGWILFDNVAPYDLRYGHAAYLEKIVETDEGTFFDIKEGCEIDGKVYSRRISANDHRIRGYYWEADDGDILAEKERLIKNGKQFVMIDLENMTVDLYKNGTIYKNFVVDKKAAPWRYWQTPTGIFKVLNKEEEHYSSLFKVYMPYSLHFKNDFFVHGEVYYPDGTVGTSEYTSGCLALDTGDMEELYSLLDTGDPILII